MGQGPGNPLWDSKQDNLSTVDSVHYEAGAGDKAAAAAGAAAGAEEAAANPLFGRTAAAAAAGKGDKGASEGQVRCCAARWLPCCDALCCARRAGLGWAGAALLPVLSWAALPCGPRFCCFKRVDEVADGAQSSPPGTCSAAAPALPSSWRSSLPSSLHPSPLPPAGRQPPV